MPNKFTTEQGSFWAGDLGSDYVERNKIDASISWRTALFSKIIARTKNVSKVLEIGSNVGLNLKAVKNL